MQENIMLFNSLNTKSAFRKNKDKEQHVLVTQINSRTKKKAKRYHEHKQSNTTHIKIFITIDYYTLLL